MLLKGTIHKTKKIVRKTLQNIKSYISGGYQKLSRAPSLNLFSSTNNPNLQQLDNFYRDFCEQWESDRNLATSPRKSKSTVLVKGSMREDNAFSDSEPRVLKSKQENKGTAKQNTASFQTQNGREDHGHGLAQKMKEMEMMDVHDVDHVLDIEEVLHYYSRLKSPVYQDLVNKFFMDMYSDFPIPHPYASTNSSMQRLGPLKI